MQPHQSGSAQHVRMIAGNPNHNYTHTHTQHARGMCMCVTECVSWDLVCVRPSTPCIYTYTDTQHTHTHGELSLQTFKKRNRNKRMHSIPFVWRLMLRATLRPNGLCEIDFICVDAYPNHCCSNSLMHTVPWIVQLLWQNHRHSKKKWWRKLFQTRKLCRAVGMQNAVVVWTFSWNSNEKHTDAIGQNNL